MYYYFVTIRNYIFKNYLFDFHIPKAKYIVNAECIVFIVTSVVVPHKNSKTHCTKNEGLRIKKSIKNFLSKCDQIRSLLRIWPNLMKKSLTENFFLCAVTPCNFRLELDLC